MKADLFGRVERSHSNGDPLEAPSVVRRDTRAARWWIRPLARALAAREARCLRELERRLPSSSGHRFPRLISWQGGVLIRSWVDGLPLQQAGLQPARFHVELQSLIFQLHRQRICHNDLAKEPNILVGEDGRPVLVDWQLGSVHRRRGARFRLQAREDLRHVLKHKRHYRREELRPRELEILARPSWVARLWRRGGKPIYLFLTRRVFGWADREGAGDRGAAGKP